MNEIRVFLVENHNVVRAGLCALLQGLDDIEVIGEAGDGEAALAAIASFAPEQRPHVVLMDISMNGMNGIEATARLLRMVSGVRVLILSMYEYEEYVLSALQAGASGYLLKDSGPVELENAIRAVTRNEMPLSPAVSRHIIDAYVRRVGPHPAWRAFTALREEEDGKSRPEHAAERLADKNLAPLGDRSSEVTLTPRQTEILRLIAEGRPTKEIAVRLNLSVKTVESHRAALMERLDIHDVASLVRYAIRSGLIAPDL